MKNRQIQKEIVTAYGTLKSVINDEYYKSGQLKSAMVAEESILETPYGKFIPNYSDSEIRKKYREAITFFEDGSLESIYLEEPQPIETSVGRIDAELVTFYPNGEVKRLFPLYGRTSGYWTEENEYELAKKVELTLFNQVFYVSPLCITFFSSGHPKSLTIWQQENIVVDTEYGQIKSRFGFELTEAGKLKSIEPLFGTSLTTEYGILYPYDSENYRLHAEGNSLSFDENGKLLSAKTIKNKIIIEKNGKKHFIEAQKIVDSLTGVERLSSLKLIFGDSSVRIENVDGWNEQFEKSTVSII